MQTPNDLSQRILNTFLATSNWLARWFNRLGLGLYRAWVWFNNVNWPRLPLTPYQWIALFYVILAVLFMLATPPFEAGAELRHYALVQHVAETGDLPVQDAQAPALWREYGNQPPLYYLGASALISPIDTSNFDALLNFNRHRIDQLDYLGNKNLLLRDAPFMPLEGAVLAVYLLRIVNIVFGIGTIWLVYRIGRHIAPQRQIAGYVAAAITAFNPMFLFVSASVSNLPLVMLINAGIIYVTLLLLYHGFDWRRSLLLGALVALAAVTHLSGLLLMLLVLAAGAWAARYRQDWRGYGILAACVLGLFAIVAGWWYVRNLMLYGDLTGLSVASQLAGLRVTSFDLLGEFQLFRMSFWGIFGVLNIQGSVLFYALVDFAVVLSLFGVLFLVMQLVSIRDFSYARRELYGLVFILSVVLLSMIGYFVWISRVATYEGKLLFPFLGAIMPMLAVGFVEVVWWLLFLLSPPERSFVRAGEAVTEHTLREGSVWPMRFMGLMALMVPLFIIAPAYAPPAAQDTVPEPIDRVYADYGPVELVAYDIPDRRYNAGDWVDVTLYWRVREQSDTDNMLSLALVNPGGFTVGQLDTIPGAGTLRTTAWEPGKIYADTYRIRLRPSAVDTGYPIRLHVNWWDSHEQQVLQAVDGQGETLEAVMLNAGVIYDSRRPETPGYIKLSDRLTEAQQLAAVMTPAPEATPTPEPEEVLEETPGQYDFGTVLRLKTFRLYYQPEDAEDRYYELRILWEAQSPPGQSYVGFAHVVGPNETLITQADVRPSVPTNYWNFRDEIIVRYPLELPEDMAPGEYEVRVGWYHVDEDGVIERLLLPEPEDAEAEAPENASENTSEDVEDELEIMPPDYVRVFNFVIEEDGTITTPELPVATEEEEEATEAATEAGEEVGTEVVATVDAEATAWPESDDASGEQATADETDAVTMPTESASQTPTQEG
ncbi:hypothetical protein G4Y79_18125 [Phototrophicus methaneseepsis]|uniref:Glycosyltransferase RgtA/B/C/D-like domain-containing protein n=1 Tax=Phototrophicus methaneseepsis TaxID=2710758 RepID=A0A7S8E750_9CHLR|nr:hypothetical protein [Phototrophicus methaneseepsis]QPC81592.1 hypothetical protein G4Y79_18125 [Phototrophicus methaneseepsis]